MDMNFPHREMQDGRAATGAILAHAMARQAGSPTARAMMFAVPAETATSDSVSERIHYFAGHAHGRGKPFGAFFARTDSGKPNKSISESVVYQSASTNFKTNEANHASPVAVSLPEAAGGSRTI